MTPRNSCSNRRLPHRTRQTGLVLLITLIMLVAMTLGGIALIRSVHTTTMIAGNLAFQQSTVQSANLGQEAAITWLAANNTDGGLDQHRLNNGYSASRRVPQAGTSWETYWNQILAPAGKVTLGVDAAGNTVEYVIDRLCNATGAANAGAGCARGPALPGGTEGNSMGAGKDNPDAPGAVFYRILTRVQGPRSTSSFIETVVSM